MNIAFEQSYRLVARGGMGLACDKDGVTLGTADLVRVHLEPGGRPHCEVQPSDKVGKILQAAYGPQPGGVVVRLHEGLRRVAASIEAGDLARAGVGAVLLGFPDIRPEAMAKLAEIADLEKGGEAWRTEPRIPRGQPGGGQWTADGGGAAEAEVASDKPAARAEDAPPARPALLLDDGVYRPGVDHARLIPVGGAEEEEEEPRGWNGAPPDFTPLLESFPFLRDYPLAGVPTVPLDLVFGTSGWAEVTNRDLAADHYRNLWAEIKAIDPSLLPSWLMRPGGIDSMNWAERNNALYDLEMRLAAAYYRVRGDIRPLQRETLRFLQREVDKAYAEGVTRFEADKLPTYLSREEAIGNFIDREVREKLKSTFDSMDVPYGRGKEITINNRDYDISDPDHKSYTIPDARLRDISYDWTLTPKSVDTPQIQGFFRAVSNISGVFIVRPREVGGSHLIPRPLTVAPRRPSMRTRKLFIPQNLGDVMDLLGTMEVHSPTFIRKNIYYPDDNIDTTFLKLNEGLQAIRGQLGEGLYLKLQEMSDRMRALFEADPEDKTGDSSKGREIIRKMMNAVDPRDILDSMTRMAPKFIGRGGKSYTDEIFRAMNEGLDMNRERLGEGPCLRLRKMSDEARARFEADPDDTTGKTREGRAILREMIRMLKPDEPDE